TRPPAGGAPHDAQRSRSLAAAGSARGAGGVTRGRLPPAIACDTPHSAAKSRTHLPPGLPRPGAPSLTGVCSGYARKSVTSRKRLKNNVLQCWSFMPIATKIRSELIRCPKKVLRIHAQNPLILQI